MHAVGTNASQVVLRVTCSERVYCPSASSALAFAGTFGGWRIVDWTGADGDDRTGGGLTSKVSSGDGWASTGGAGGFGVGGAVSVGVLNCFVHSGQFATCPAISSETDTRRVQWGQKRSIILSVVCAAGFLACRHLPMIVKNAAGWKACPTNYATAGGAGFLACRDLPMIVKNAAGWKACPTNYVAKTNAGIVPSCITNDYGRPPT